MGCTNSKVNKTYLETSGDFPHFKGKVFRRNDINYEVHRYQYATTSQPKDSMSPYAIVYVADDEDIIKAIHYAKSKNIAIAVRSGGHSYTGCSSTRGENIQIDLGGGQKSPDKPYFYESFVYHENLQTVTLGVGNKLGDVGKKCRKLGILFPHGECSNVHVGGHCQTGGYGIMVRPFGLLVDYIESFDIIMSDGIKRRIERHSPSGSERELFSALLVAVLATMVF